MRFFSPEVHKTAAAPTALRDRVCALLARPEVDSRIVLHAAGKVRRFWLVHFCRRYVRRQLSLRKGSCRQCGFCCNMLFTCPLLTGKGDCVGYGFCRPGSCRAFPLDQRDIDEAGKCGGLCGYHFAPPALSAVKTRIGPACCIT